MYQATPPSAKPCNRFPCRASSLSWSVGSWSRCTAGVIETPSQSSEAVTVTAGGVVIGARVGTLSRTVTCVDSFTTPMPDEVCEQALPPSSRPVGNAACPLLRTVQPVSCASSQVCLDQMGPTWVCDSHSSTCVCESTWTGADCGTRALPPRDGMSCRDGVMDVDGVCCTGAIDYTAGRCCTGNGTEVDRAGRCCDGGRVDACGVCNGTGVAVDATGVCCDSVLPPSGLCCPRGVAVDSCGVCGGANLCR